MRVLVTGATGNVGTALLRRMAGERVQVSGLARRVPRPSGGPPSGVRWHALDLSSSVAPGVLREAMADVDAVVHCAWRIQPSHDEAAMHAVNVGGTRAVVAAAAATGVAHLVHLSSVAVYAPGPVDDRGVKQPVAEDWPATGIETSGYSRHKVEAEGLLGAAKARPRSPVLTVVRPGLVVQPEAGPEIARYFLGPLVPVRPLLRAARALPVPVLPLPRELQVPVVHADDLADALWRVLERRVPGDLNIAAEPGLDADALARAFGAARSSGLPLRVLRALASAAWHARLQPTDPGWVDIGARTPLLSTERARRDLGWAPATDAATALDGLVAALAGGPGRDGGPTPVMGARTALRGRLER